MQGVAPTGPESFDPAQVMYETQDPNLLGSFDQFPEMGVSIWPYSVDEHTILTPLTQVGYFNPNDFDGLQDISFPIPILDPYFVEGAAEDPAQHPVQLQQQPIVSVARSARNSMVSP